MRGVYYSACSLCYKTIAQFHQKCLLMRDCLLFRRLLLPESTVLCYWDYMCQYPFELASYKGGQTKQSPWQSRKRFLWPLKCGIVYCACSCPIQQCCIVLLHFQDHWVTEWLAIPQWVHNPFEIPKSRVF